MGRDSKDDLIRELEEEKEKLQYELERVKKPKFMATEEQLEEAIKELTGDNQ